ncbi:putative phosphotransferase enzyme family protein [Aspergillus terreus]|uniref:Putative phosphotransferase enzyme family protein n=1 Tax=Aspergillus terreus TaxID=33178 RepID=A0A5M3YNC6_ASPTE|nr:hypothetical protein ATETN484_0002003000 [Aspergillus terreus]GFF13679.1 putative phosphotransferase enzyme family protein [Aspergillus terreus]
MGAVLDALRSLRQRALKVSSTKQKLLRPAVGDNTAAGRRIIPAQTHDGSIGVRIDRGMQVDKRIKIYVQPNKNADNRTIKELANQNSHQNLAETWVDTEDPIDNSTVDKVFDALEASAREKGH